MNSAKMQNQVDIDKVIEEVKNWDKHTEKLTQENEELRKQIFVLEKRCELSRNGEVQAREEVDQLRKVISVMQETIEKHSSTEEESRQGKNEIRKLKDNERTLQMLAQKKEQDAKERIEALKELNMKEIDQISCEFEEKTRKLKSDQLGALQEKDVQIVNLKRKNSELDREKQTEIMMIRLEYDEKIQKLLKQNSNQSQSSSGSSSSSLKNEILRKKLQHVQAEKDKEIKDLKNRISEMERGDHFAANKQQQQAQKRRKLSVSFQ